MIFRLIFAAALIATSSALAAPVDKRFIGKWYGPGQLEICKIGASPITAKMFAGCEIVTASTPEINKYGNGGVTQYLAVDCTVESGSETNFYWLHLDTPETGSYGRVGAGDREIIRKCPRQP